MSRRALIVICLFGVACGGSPSTAPSPAPGAQASAVVIKYLNDLVDIMQANSVNRLVIEWTSFRSQVLSAAGSAQAIADASPAITVALGLLNDHHSFYQRATGGGISNPRFPSGCAVPAVADATVPADIGYLRIGAFSGNAAAEVALATDLHSRIAAQDRDGLAGWIVDLRGNGGGDMWPMLAGAGPILGEGTAGYFIAPAYTTAWGYNGTASVDGTFLAVQLEKPYRLIAQNPRVAVLTNEAVASSGEAIVVAFRGRPNARSFGARTCGVPTANRAFVLSDGSSLFLTTAVDADRNRVTYDSAIPPDETSTDPDATVARAIAWIRGG